MPAGGGAISLMQADGGKPHKVVENQPGEFGSSFGPPAWAPDGKRFAFVRNRYHAGSMDSDSQIEIMDLASGETTVALNSPRLVGAVTWTNDDRLIYSVLEARPMPGDSNLWAIHIDRMNRATGDPVRLTSDSGYVTTLSLSAKGDRLGIVRETLQPDVYVADLQGGRRVSGTPRRLTLDEREDYPFAWSPDDKSVLFASNRDGNYHLFKQDINQSEPELLLGGDEQLFVPRLSPDKSQILYFATSTLKGGSAFSIAAFAMGVRLMRLPVAGGPPQMLLERPDITNVQCARLPSKLCLFSTVDQVGQHLFSFDPMTGTSQEIPQLAMKTLDYSKHNWSLSPDGETLVTSGRQHTSASGSSAIPVLNLISLNGFATRTIPVPNWASITTLDWAADGKSVWASAHNTDNTYALLNIDVDGHIRPVLREDKMILGWAIPSSDGRHLALWKANTNSNVWMLKHF
jgi:Tol biopolymer transport system component